jgi:hypothetical protein
MTVEASPQRPIAPEHHGVPLAAQDLGGARKSEQLPNAPSTPEPQKMLGWFAETTLTGTTRDPLMTGDNVQKKWGYPYGALVAEITLPFQERSLGGGRASANREDLKGRVLQVFDARSRPEEPPHFIVATTEALEYEAALKEQPPIVRGPNPDIQHLYTGDQLLIGRKAGRWLPTAVRRQEEERRRAGSDRSLISSKQGGFYVGEDAQLHLRSEGYNPLLLIAHRTPEESTRSQAFYESLDSPSSANRHWVPSEARHSQTRPENYTGRHRHALGALAAGGKHRAHGSHYRGKHAGPSRRRQRRLTRT